MQMKKACLSLLGFVVVMFAVLSAGAQEAAIGSPDGAAVDSAAPARIVQPGLVDRLNRGESQVDVIVLMKGHKDYVGRIKADKPAEMKASQAEIRRNRDQVLNRLNRADFKLRHQFDNILGFSATVNKAGFEALAAMPEVESIEEDQIAEAVTAQGIALMNATQVRSLYGGTGVSIAIVDTGIDYTHAQLGGGGFPNAKVIGGYDLGDNDANPMDCQGHGTSVAGIAAGTAAAGPGDYIGGVANNAKLYALKIVAGCGNTAAFSTIAAAWDWAVTHRNDNPANPIVAINTSFGGGYYTSPCDASLPAVAAAANTAVANGITLFSAAGNNGYINGISGPACVTNSLSVGAVYDTNDIVAYYSNSANFLSILAPSDYAYTTAVGGGYNPYFNGTSAASPYAAGAGALLQSYAKTAFGIFYPPATLRARMVSTGDPVTDSKNGITKPRVNVGAAAYRTYSRVALGANHTAALKPEGTLWAWGQNNFGQLGDSTAADKIYPVQIGAGNTWISVASGWHHSFAIRSDGTLWGWGYNRYGSVGDGTTVNRSSPVQIGAGSTWTSVAAGAYGSVGLKSDGTLWSWGRGATSLPVRVGAENTWVSIAAGWAHNMALKSDGTLWAWGDNSQGQLGDGTTVGKSTPVQIGAGYTWISVAPGEFHTAAVRSDGSLWAWGYNYYGQLGDGTTANKISPVRIGAGNTWVAVAASEYHTAGLKSDGTLWAWGYNYYGELGDGTTVNRSAPVQIGTENTWVAIGAKYHQATAMKADGTSWAWGLNGYGQLGDGTTTSRLAPTQITGNGRLLTVTKAGTGTGTVTSSPSGIDCGPDCRDGFPLGSWVTLTAVPDGSTEFTSWSGGGCGGSNPSCSVFMSADMSVTATFTHVGDTYGGWEYCDSDRCPEGELGTVDTCDGNTGYPFTCPNGISMSCIDVTGYDPYGEWDYRFVTCVP